MTILLGPQQHEGVATAFVGIGSRGATHRHHDRRGGGELACCLLLCGFGLLVGGGGPWQRKKDDGQTDMVNFHLSRSTTCSHRPHFGEFRSRNGIQIVANFNFILVWISSVWLRGLHPTNKHLELR